MDDSLTRDQLEALAQIARARKGERESACVARNIKTLTGLKYAKFDKNGQHTLTEKGKLTLFIQRCVDGLRAVANDPNATLDADVATFLSRKGHVAPGSAPGKFEITPRGRESLADIESKQR